MALGTLSNLVGRELGDVSAESRANSIQGRQTPCRQVCRCRGRAGIVWTLLLPCLLSAGQVVLDFSPAEQQLALAVDTGRVAEPLGIDRPSPLRYLVALPPLSRATNVVLAFEGQPSQAARPLSIRAIGDSTPPVCAFLYRERDSAGWALVECWDGTPKSISGPGQPAGLQVGYEPLPRSGRDLRRNRLGNRTDPESPAFAISNPGDAIAWYRTPDTSLSPLFGGDPIPRDFDFAELAELPLGSQVIVLAHFGGWGNVPIEQAHDILPVIDGVRMHLSGAGMKSILVPFYRSRGGAVGKLLTISEMFELHHSDATRLSRDLDLFLLRHPGQRVIMIGLSNGAAFADEVMDRLSATAQGRVCAIEVGPPFLGPADAGASVLRLGNRGQDPVVTGEWWILIRTWVEGLFRRASARPPAPEDVRAEAGFVREHEYSWPSVREEVVGFLEAWLRR
ncbi:hypothetical protein FJY68_03085 [candidate division WOR-3 bacterium]|uniref:Alpha/beta hydrolase n=1 Tax=candidate division WOR-3 bacterium TaxID=2052148 RepID=A0A938BP50_UNCW3|nr:hypothetical protein [candidate division WOR-3 bacterium]